MSGCSSVGRASAFQAEGREFESRRPLQCLDSRFVVDSRPRSSGVERLLGKEEVMSSNLIAGSITGPLAVARAVKKEAGRDAREPPTRMSALLVRARYKDEQREI